MAFFKELQIFGKSILNWVYTFLTATVIAFAFGVENILIFGKELTVPFFSYRSFAVIFFDKISRDLLPEGVELIVTGPMEAFWAQVGISFFLAFIATLPVLLFCVLKFLFPAFTSAEKRTTFKVLIPSIILFFSGAIFSYYYLIPATIDILYLFVFNIGAASFFSVKEFVSMVLLLIFGIGTVFMLPIFMVLLSSLGIINPNFWKENWRYSFLFFLIFAAIVTPDGSGVTMMILTVPLTLLYAAGYIGSRKVFRS
ncbi:MAG: twin-arginine translocase subunit TatC [Minisyncoccales bacterium]|jgi:sec-independent protein translocase protein TatC